MKTDTLAQLRHAVAQLLNTSAADISLEKLTDGLSHNSFTCYAGKERFFVKVYALGADPSPRIVKINRIIAFMRQQGIPAPELVAYSPRFANVVIHRYIDARKITWDYNLIAPVAKLYSDVASIGLPNKKFVSKHDYLKVLKTLANTISQQFNEGVGSFPELNQRALNLSQTVHSCLNQELPDRNLIVLNLHDDFTEKNILADNKDIKLLCDWDSYCASVFLENLACSATRFSTQAPMQGKLDRQRLEIFLNSISPTVIQQIEDEQTFAQLFPLLAILRHLRTYKFRNLVVTHRRTDLEESLLHRPIEHCEWMLDQRNTVTTWVHEILNVSRIN